MFKEILLMSFKNLRTNRLRTALSILGVLIGIASIIALMTLGQGVSSSVTEQLSGLGGNRITISIRDTKVKSGFTDEEMDAFRNLENVSAVSPYLQKNGASVTTDDFRCITTGGYSTYAVVYGTSQYFFSQDTQIKTKYGRGLTTGDIDQKLNVCVLGYSVASEIFGNANPRGASIFVDSAEFIVWDVLEKAAATNSYYDSYIFVPYTTARDRMLMGEIKQIELLVNDSGNVDSVYDNAENMLLTLFNNRSSSFRITNQKAAMDLVVTISDLIIGMLGGIAGIALLVGGIGIMNMMLVSVRERTSEIGLRLALGAKPSLIMIQFLVEATLISLIGGILGVAIGIAIAYVACNLIGAAFLLSAETIAIAVGFSVAVGVLFGILPARKASRLNPIDALKTN